MSGNSAETAKLLERLDQLYTGVISDALDETGHWNHCLDPAIRPLVPGMRVVGVAWTMAAANLPEETAGATLRPYDPEDHFNRTYRHEFGAIESMPAGGVLVATCGGAEAALWGELLSTAAMARQARGAIVDGNTRDARAIVEYGFPVFARGYSPYSSGGRLQIQSVGEPIQVGGAVVRAGDLIIADIDGAVVIPIERAEAVLAIAERRISAEGSTRDELRLGAGINEVYQRYKTI